MGRTRAFLVAATLLMAVPATTLAKVPPCPGGRYLVVGGALARGGEDGVVDTVELSGKTISIASGCTPTKARLRGTKAGTRVTAKWKSCAGLEGAARLKGMITEHCRTLSATFSVKAMKVTKPVIAGLSACGDGIWDPQGGEECDGTLGPCGGLCSACRCAGGTTTTIDVTTTTATTTTAVPPTTGATTTSTTSSSAPATTSTSTTSPATTSTTTTTPAPSTSTTSTTAAPGSTTTSTTGVPGSTSTTSTTGVPGSTSTTSTTGVPGSTSTTSTSAAPPSTSTTSTSTTTTSSTTSTSTSTSSSTSTVATSTVTSSTGPITTSSSSTSTSTAPSTSSSTSTTTLVGADLRALSFAPPFSMPANTLFSISYTVRNSGTVTAVAPWSDYVLFSSDDTLGGDTFLGVYQHLSNLAPATSYSASPNVTSPSVPPGTYYMFFQTDGAGQVGETNESNNVIGPVAVTITTPDLAPTAFSGPGAAASGATISVTYTVKNQGNAIAPGAWTDYVWLSTDTVFGGDTFLGGFTNTPLAVGATYTKTSMVTLPALAPGTYRLFFQADGADTLYEGGADANNVSGPITIVVS